MTNIKNRKRRSISKVTVALTIILVFTFFLLINTFGNFNAYGDGETELIKVTVEAGDSLWAIADRYTPQDSDLRETISLIRSINHLDSEMLMVGDIISVPKVY